MSLRAAPAAADPDADLDHVDDGASVAPGSAPSPPRLDALDGLRGLAVAGVLAYHLGAPWARGGFLGVSLFFTLSGFLITSLLLGEVAHTGRIDLRRFWARRALRLLPAALAGLALVVAYAAVAGGPSQVRNLRGDVVAALGAFANWHFILGGHGYASLWEAPSPVQHYWSLAVEQQLYVVLPLVVLGALRLGRGRRWPLAAVLTLATVASTALGHAASHGPDVARAYYGTDTRAAELLVGALLAVLVAVRPSWLRRAALTRAGAVALVLLLTSWAIVGDDDRILFDGLLLGHAVLTGVLIAAVHRPSLLQRVLSFAPLRAIGRVSYGAYLFHWPLFLWLSPQRTGLSPVPLAVVRLVVTAIVAVASHRFVERPFLHGRRRLDVRWVLMPGLALAGVAALLAASAPPPDLLTAGGAPFAGAGVGADAVDVSPGRPHEGAAVATVPASLSTPSPSSSPPGPRVGVRLDEADAVGFVRATPPVAVPSRTPLLPGERLRVLLVGDSTMFGLGLVMAPYGERSGRFALTNGGVLACHIVRGGAYRWAAEPPKATEPSCNEWEAQRTAQLAAVRPHVTVVAYSVFDLLDRRLPGSDEWRHLGQPSYDALARRELEAFASMLERSGTRTLWLTSPRIRSGVVDHVPPVHDYVESDPARVERWNALVAETVVRHPSMQLVDFRSWVRAELPDELDPHARPDGMHLTPPYLRREARWLTPQIEAAAAR